MKPAPFTYHLAHDVAEAVALLTDLGEDAKVLAGGQSLVPMMNLRLARPSALVDITRIPGLDYLRAGPDGLARLIGPNRARVLRLLQEPRSTTQLAALTGLPLGAVGNHLRVLLEAGAVLRRRAGREVLYWRTSLGDALAAPGR